MGHELELAERPTPRLLTLGPGCGGLRAELVEPPAAPRTEAQDSSANPPKRQIDPLPNRLRRLRHRVLPALLHARAHHDRRAVPEGELGLARVVAQAPQLKTALGTEVEAPDDRVGAERLLGVGVPPDVVRAGVVAVEQHAVKRGFGEALDLLF